MNKLRGPTLIATGARHFERSRRRKGLPIQRG
jgi:hypothetical protein